MTRNEVLATILKETGTFSEQQLGEIIAESQQKNAKSLETFLLKEKKMAEEMLYRIIGQHYNVPFVPLLDIQIKDEVLQLVPETIAAGHKLIAYEKTDTTISLATTDPSDIQTFEFINKKTGLQPQIHITTPTALEEALNYYHRNITAEFGINQNLDNKLASDPKALSKLAEELPTVRIVESILEHAILEKASDIHIEPAEKEMVVRVRVDGILRQLLSFPAYAAPGITARIKILSNLRLDEHRLPQDGRFKIEKPNYLFSVRVSILPVYDGEKIVMRLLSEGTKALTLEQLGFTEKTQAIIMRNITKPHGLVLVTGPTGSGKTTTLYSVMGILNTPKVNISTVEDPIEYRMPGVNQSQVASKIGFTFAIGLRALLRQDPNVIMVGEIRDEETAGIAVQAAMTGHLVLGTLHTNDASTSLPRLVDMNVPPFLIGATANLILAQRLVRKICPHCIKSEILTKEKTKELTNELDIDAIWKRLQESGVIPKKQTLADTTFWRGAGCGQCHNEGYRGRVGIYEILEVTPSISALITARATAAEIETAAKKEGMVSLFDDGFSKAFTGVTTIDEVLRVTKE